jgi:DNA (cytosine-5)-methyltransferase 1
LNQPPSEGYRCLRYESRGPVPYPSDRTVDAGVSRGVVDLFAGIGCVARGFVSGGDFRVAGLIDNDSGARDTYLHNFPGDNYLLGDVAKLTKLEARMLRGDDMVGLLGCPPCQGFSAAGLRKQRDVRNRLLSSFFATLDLFAPLFFVMENVPAIAYQRRLKGLLAERQDRYATCIGVLNSACYGLPQTRERTIVIGYRRDLELTPTLPAPTHFGTRPVFDYRGQGLRKPNIENIDALLGVAPPIGVEKHKRHSMRKLLPNEPGMLADLVSVADAIRDLPRLDGGRGAPASTYAKRLRMAGSAPNHEGWRHRPELVARMAAVPEGGASETEKRYYSQAYARLHRRGLARTLTTNFHNPGCGRFTHYAEPRTLTVREAARLQGVQDSFEFIGHRSLQERLVGNAFPPLWAEAIGAHVAAELCERLPRLA